MWFNQSIIQALSQSKNERLILMVYLEGDNELSKEMTKLLESDESIKQIVTSKTIALKLVENSENAKMFQQAYSVKQSPTIYLVSYNGTLIDTFSNSIDKELFISKLNEHSIKANPKKLNEPTNVQSRTESQETSKDNRSIEEKTKELLEKVREKNKQEKEERSKNSEMQRIRAGKDLQKLKKEREDQETKNLIEERKKDALFEKQERERVLRAIEEDKEEKKKKFELERQKREEEYKKLQAEKTNQLKHRDVIKLEENEIKIQFKLRDATSLRTKFKLDDTLQCAVDYLKENCDLKNFQLAITYPKRNFTDQDFNAKFIDLGIKNSAVILVVEKSVPGSSSNKIVNHPSIFNQLWEILIKIYTVLFTLITGLFSSIFGNAGDATETNQSPTTTAVSNQSANDLTKDNNRPSTSEGLNSNRRNFKSFKTNPDDDNNTNTYNGNSTEQQ